MHCHYIDVGLTLTSGLLLCKLSFFGALNQTCMTGVCLAFENKLAAAKPKQRQPSYFRLRCG